MKHWTKEEMQRGALPITRAELEALGIPSAEIDSGQSSGKLKTYGPWQLPMTYTALAMSVEWTPDEIRCYTAERDSAIAYGMRTLGSIRESGYELEGRVSVNGKKHRAFTSSQLFELENGKLVSVATIHVCLK